MLGFGNYLIYKIYSFTIRIFQSSNSHILNQRIVATSFVEKYSHIGLDISELGFQHLSSYIHYC